MSSTYRFHILGGSGAVAKVVFNDEAQSAHGRANAQRGGKNKILRGCYCTRVTEDDSIEKLKKTANKLNILNRTSQPHSHYSPFVWQIVSINSFGPTRASWSKKQGYESIFFNLDLTHNVTRNFKEQSHCLRI